MSFGVKPDVETIFYQTSFSYFGSETATELENLNQVGYSPNE
jgi:hypothetical protein